MRRPLASRPLPLAVFLLVLSGTLAAQTCPQPWPIVPAFHPPTSPPPTLTVSSGTSSLELVHGPAGYTVHRLVDPEAGTYDFLSTLDDPLRHDPNAFNTNRGLPGSFPIVAQPAQTGLFSLMWVQSGGRTTRILGPADFDRTKVFDFGSVVFIVWSQQDVVPGEVFVVARIWGHDGQFDFDLLVFATPNGHRLLRYAYPIFKASPLSTPAPAAPLDFDVLVLPIGGGTVIPDPTSPSQPFPRFLPVTNPGSSMQLFNLYKANADLNGAPSRSLIWFTKDGQGHRKELFLDRGVDFCPPGGPCNPLARSDGVQFAVTHFPTVSPLPISLHVTAYPCTLTAAAGDWFDAASVYREWALGRSWADRGPIASAQDFSASMKDVRLHLLQYPDHLSGFDNFPLLANDAALLGTVLGAGFDRTMTLWADWHQGLFNVDMPHFDAPRQTTAAGILQAQAQGVLVIPYVSLELWSQNSPDFSTLDVGPFVWTDYDLNQPVILAGPATDALFSPHFRINSAFAGARAAKAEVVEDVVDVFPNAVWDGHYADAWSNSPTEVDFNPNLPFTKRGGGSAWNVGRRLEGDLFTAVGRSRRPDAIRESEIIHETVIDKLELMHYAPIELGVLPLIQLPVWETVYHDLVMTSDLSIGIPPACTPQLFFNLNLLHYDFHLGKVIGFSNFFADQFSFVNPVWPCGADNPGPALAVLLGYAQKLIASEECVRRFRVLGQRLSPQPDDPGRQLERTLAVQPASTSIWRAPNGDTGIIASNSSPTVPAVVTIDIDFAKYGLSGIYDVYRCVDAGPRVLFFAGLATSVAVPEVVFPQSVVLYEIVAQ